MTTDTSAAMTPREAVARSLEASRLCAQPWDALPKSVRDAELRRADAILAALRDAGFAVVPRITDTERNRVIGLAEMVEDKASRIAPGMPGRDFYTDIADTLRGAARMLAVADGETR